MPLHVHSKVDVCRRLKSFAALLVVQKGKKKKLVTILHSANVKSLFYPQYGKLTYLHSSQSHGKWQNHRINQAYAGYALFPKEFGQPCNDAQRVLARGKRG